MSVMVLKDNTRQIEQLEPEDKLTLLTWLVESLRRQMQPARRSLSAYYGLGTGHGFKTAQEVDTFIRQGRALWER